VNRTGHVLVARLDSDGDVLLAGPAIRAVASRAEKVTLLCSPRAEQAARLLPGVDQVLLFDAPWIAADPAPIDHADVLRVMGLLSASEIDEAIVLTSFHQSALPLALVLRMAWIPSIAAISDDYPGALLDLRHHVRDDVHEVERNLSLCAAAGYRLASDDDDRLVVRRDPASRPDTLPHRPYVVVHPGASVAARAWSPQRNASLVRALSRDFAVVVTGSRQEKALCEDVAGTSPTSDVVNLAGRTSLAALAEVLAGAEVVVVGNTGPAHLAAAVGTPVASLFAPTVPAVRWHPWRVPHVLLGQQDIGCAGCRARRCPVIGQPCLGAVSVEEVCDAVRHLVDVRHAAP
jgi:ADP-heptose:LPS heptosyltransferase